MDSGWIDVLVFAAIAGFLWLKLRKSLGEVGQDSPPPLELPKIIVEKTIIKPVVQPQHLASHWNSQLPDYTLVSSATAHQQVGQLLAHYNMFEPTAFLEGAKRALPMIVHAYVANDVPLLNKLLVPQLAANFVERNAARTTPYSAHVHEVKKATIAGAKLDGIQALITVDFVSVETINNHPKRDVHDTWTFIKDTTDTTSDTGNIWLLHTIHDAIEE